MSIKKLISELNTFSDKKRALHSQGYFKTGKGEYAEGDIFIGVRVPDIRKLAKEYQDLSKSNCIKLLKSPVHEQRLLALVILTLQYKNGDTVQQQQIFENYLKYTKYINNWDLVDSSAHKIVGCYLLKKNKSILGTLARSSSLWERRIAIVATYHFIKHGQYSQTAKLAKILLNDKHDLIHKAVGWMLREIGKKDSLYEQEFLNLHASKMPRTMLRYAIEKMSPRQRKIYLEM